MNPFLTPPPSPPRTPPPAQQSQSQQRHQAAEGVLSSPQTPPPQSFLGRVFDAVTTYPFVGGPLSPRSSAKGVDHQQLPQSGESKSTRAGSPNESRTRCVPFRECGYICITRRMGWNRTFNLLVCKLGHHSPFTHPIPLPPSPPLQKNSLSSFPLLKTAEGTNNTTADAAPRFVLPREEGHDEVRVRCAFRVGIFFSYEYTRA